MFGLTIEKLFLVALVAGLVLGPTRLPQYAHQLAQAVRTLRTFIETTRAAAVREIGVPLQHSEWQSFDLRQYDPRRIVGDALKETTPSKPAAPPFDATTEVLIEEATRVRPGQKYLVTGPSAHPHRILIASLPENDPRRIAAGAQPMADVTPPDRLPTNS